MRQSQPAATFLNALNLPFIELLGGCQIMFCLVHVGGIEIGPSLNSVYIKSLINCSNCFACDAAIIAINTMSCHLVCSDLADECDGRSAQVHRISIAALFAFNIMEWNDAHAFTRR